MSIISKKISNIFVILLLSIISCVSNYEPAILEIISSTKIVDTGGLVSLQCIAKDEDELSIRDLDSLTYKWFASAGTFVKPDTLDTLYGPQNIIMVLDTIDSIPDPSKIYWVAADSLGFGIDTGFQTITCQVGDINDAKDIFSILIRVQ